MWRMVGWETIVTDFPTSFLLTVASTVGYAGQGKIVTSPKGILISASRSELEVDNAPRSGAGSVVNNVTLDECDQIQYLPDEVCGCVLQDEEVAPTSPPVEKLRWRSQANLLPI
jgi:hypothetical protein